MSGSPKLENFYAQRIVVGVGDLAISNNPSVVLSSYALGSCIGIVGYNPETLAGGILHFMLPDSRLSTEKAKKQPSMFADTGITAFMKGFEELGNEPQKMNFFITGGASVITHHDVFKIGNKNAEAAKAIFQELAIPIFGEDIGGLNNRTLHFNLDSGTLEIKTPSGATTITLK